MVDQPTRTSRSPIVGGVIAAIVIATVSTFAVVGRERTTNSNAFRVPACTESTTVECLRSWTVNNQNVQAELSNGDRLSYKAGIEGDIYLVGNWLCGSLSTLAIYRPSTGVVYFLDSWPRTTDKPTTYADQTQRKGLNSAAFHIGDFNDDGCADLGIDAEGARTWHLPAVQKRRLQIVSAT
jgi:hypothetical protein